MPDSAQLFVVAETLDESPAELLNGAASAGLHALDATAGEIAALASARGLDATSLEDLWSRAQHRLTEMPNPADVYEAAAEAATLLYAAAWVVESDSVTVEELASLV